MQVHPTKGDALEIRFSASFGAVAKASFYARYDGFEEQKQECDEIFVRDIVVLPSASQADVSLVSRRMGFRNSEIRVLHKDYCYSQLTSPTSLYAIKRKYPGTSAVLFDDVKLHPKSAGSPREATYRFGSFKTQTSTDNKPMPSAFVLDYV